AAAAGDTVPPAADRTRPAGLTAEDGIAAGTGGALALAGLALAALVHRIRTRTDRSGP
ncbi:Myxococcales GC_trans_RRR domain-containing protein, partial [Streptomyces sp. DvalAA-14]